MSQPNESQNPADQAKRKNVLLIDDAPNVLLVFEEFLTVNGCTVKTAANGTDALNQLKQMDFDAICCDLMMPDMTGETFYNSVQQVKPQLCSRFVLVTGYVGHSRLEEFIKREKIVALYKPVSADALIGALNQVLNGPTAENG